MAERKKTSMFLGTLAYVAASVSLDVGPNSYSQTLPFSVADGEIAVIHHKKRKHSARFMQDAASHVPSAYSAPLRTSGSPSDPHHGVLLTSVDKNSQSVVAMESSFARSEEDDDESDEKTAPVAKADTSKAEAKASPKAAAKPADHVNDHHEDKGVSYRFLELAFLAVLISLPILLLLALLDLKDPLRKIVIDTEKWSISTSRETLLEPQEKYDSYQSMAQNMVTMSTLVMGFIITGALLSISFTGEEHFHAKQVHAFIDKAIAAFTMSVIAVSLSFVMSMVGTQLRARNKPNAAEKATIFFMRFYFLIFFAEFCIYQSASWSIGYVGEYLKMAYVIPSEDICPLSSGLPHCSTNKPDPGKFCSQLGRDFYDLAEKMCGQNAIPEDDKNKQMVCSEFRKHNIFYADYAKSGSCTGNQTFPELFGYAKRRETRSTSEELKLSPDEVQEGREQKGLVMNTAVVLGFALCGVNEAQEERDLLCNSTNQKGCSRARATWIAADACAGQKYDDTMKCYRSCLSFRPDGDNGLRTDETEFNYISPHLNERLDEDIEDLMWGVDTWTWVRIVMYVVMHLHDKVTFKRGESATGVGSDDEA